MNPKTLQMIMGYSSIQFTLDVYMHLETGDIKKEFFSMLQNKNYDFYSLNRVLEIVAPVDDTEYEEPEADMDEKADDDD